MHFFASLISGLFAATTLAAPVDVAARGSSKWDVNKFYKKCDNHNKCDYYLDFEVEEVLEVSIVIPDNSYDYHGYGREYNFIIEEEVLVIIDKTDDIFIELEFTVEEISESRPKSWGHVTPQKYNGHYLAARGTSDCGVSKFYKQCDSHNKCNYYVDFEVEEVLEVTVVISGNSYQYHGYGREYSFIVEEEVLVIIDNTDNIFIELEFTIEEISDRRVKSWGYVAPKKYEGH